MKAWVIVLGAAVLAACGPTDADVAPAPLLPPAPRLSPMLATLREIAAAGPAAPEEQRLNQLLDLGGTAFVPGLADQRLALRSRQALLAEPDACWALEALLLHEHSLVRRQAAHALGEVGSPASVPPLILRLKYETDPDVRVWVAAALAMLHNGAGLPDLMAAVERGDQAAGLQVMEILARAGRDPGEQPTYLALRQDLEVLAAEWQRTGLLPPAVTARQPDPSVEARLAARLLVLEEFRLRPVDDTRFILSRCGRTGVPLLRRSVLAVEPFLRSHALEVLRELGPAGADAAGEVLQLIGDPQSRVDAVRTLGASRSPDALPAVRGLLDAADLELRAAVAGALGPMGDRESEARLRRMMEDATEHMDVRVQAAFSLAIFERARPGLHFLQQRLEAGDYHAPTLRELLDRVEGWR